MAESTNYFSLQILENWLEKQGFPKRVRMGYGDYRKLQAMLNTVSKLYNVDSVLSTFVFRGTIFECMDFPARNELLDLRKIEVDDAPWRM